jgi:hypothetical protein
MSDTYLRGGLMAVALGLLLTTGQVQAQLPLDIAAGVTFANVSTDEFDTSSKTGFFAAVGTAFPLGENLSLQPYVGYVQKGTSFGPDGDDGEDTYSYIEIPVFFAMAFPLSETLNLGISAGPQVGFLIDCKESAPGFEDFDCKEYDNYDGDVEFGLLGSVGLQFPVGGSNLTVGAGYDRGLTDIFTDLDGGYKNSVFYLFVDYGLSLGGM